MRSLAFRSILALSVARNVRSFAPSSSTVTSVRFLSSSVDTKRFMSSGGEPPQITQINKQNLHEIIEDVENSSREESGYVIIDVRGYDEVAMTGKVADCVETLPLPDIAQMGALKMDDEDFEEQFGFKKPDMDETIVFTCKAGIRSMHASQYAAMSGYTNLVNYTGGADEWFR